MSKKKAVLIVVDSCGVGALPDAADFGDEGVNTLAHLAKAEGGVSLPNMEKIGLGNIIDIEGVSKNSNAAGYYGKAMETSKAKDTTTGHWEIAGLVSTKPFNTYPNGFPEITIKKIEEFSGRRVVCNKPYSGTEVIDDYADEQFKDGALIVYTSADSVLQIAAHEELIPIDELYKICEKSLEICNEYSPIARVIARPYIGTKGNYKRTERRHDYSVPPSGETMLDRLKNHNLPVIGIGKTSDIFAGVGITENRKTNKNNLDGIEKTIKAIKEVNEGLIFTNLVDFDMLYGHRRDPKGYKNALEVTKVMKVAKAELKKVRQAQKAWDSPEPKQEKLYLTIPANVRSVKEREVQKSTGQRRSIHERLEEKKQIVEQQPKKRRSRDMGAR